ncbi:hypothetical protein GCM10025780_08230 [Frondihabitans cladoniiphilus]|uniref:Uncharacterized protein n=1 Tax=Frondihabitans cladoniiphilus TaxID=715785 RepID=A0ABP8VQJ9_9MICO
MLSTDSRLSGTLTIPSHTPLRLPEGARSSSHLLYRLGLQSGQDHVVHDGDDGRVIDGAGRQVSAEDEGGARAHP